MSWTDADIAPSPITDEVLNAVRKVESGGNDRAVSKAGAMGPYQFMPATARRFGLADPFHEPSAREAARKYLTQLHGEFGNLDDALRAYNAGEGTTRAVLKGQRGYAPETQAYAQKVRANMGKQSGSEQPWSDADVAWTDDDVAPAATKQSSLSPVAAEAKKMVEADTGQALKAGIALTGSKIARAINHLLPQAVSEFAEKHGYMPTEQDVEILKQSIADSAAGKGMNLFTDVAATLLPGMGAARLTRAVPLVARRNAAVRAAAEGAAAGAAGNAVIGENVGEGAAFGGVLGPVLTGAGRLANFGINAYQDVMGGARGAATSKLHELFGNRTAAAIAALRGTRGIVPGEAPTAGRAASELFPEFKALEEGARRSPGADALLMQDAQNAAARQNVLEGHARLARPGVATEGGRVPLSPAEEMRQAGTAANYARADADRITLTPELEAIIAGEEARNAARAGERAFSQQQTNAFAGGQPVPRGRTAGSPGGPGGRDAAGMPMPAIPATRSVQDLQQFKNELSARIERIRMSDPEEAYRLSVARRQLTEAMEAQSLPYAAATTNYRALSRPQNQGEIAETMLRDLRGQPGALENVSAFLRSMDNAPRTIKNSLGNSRFEQLEQVMSPQQMAEINALRRSAEREAKYQGMNVSEDVMRKYENVFHQVFNMTPGIFSQVFTAIRNTTRLLGNRTDEQVNRIVNRAMRDPAALANLMEELPPRERDTIVNMIRQLAERPEVMGGIIGAATPRMSEE
ncbi:MAG: lytic transglycosylase domain-containing protein [Thermoguttaceae bacterium]